MLRKITAFILALLFIFTALVSCAETEHTQTDSTSEDVTEAEDTWVHDEIGEKDFGKQEFVILSQKEIDIGPVKDDDVAQNDQVADAMWKRNRNIEDRFNIVLDGYQMEYKDVSNEIRKCYKGGDLNYHVVYTHMVEGATSASSGFLYNLNNLEMIDKDALWWDKDVPAGFQIEGSLYMTAGDILPFTQLMTYCIAFNKKVFDNQKLTYPYEDARNGEWTLDKMEALTKDQTKDLNGDGEINKNDDFYGFVSWHLDSPYNFFFGSGCSMISKDDDDVPFYECDTQKIQDVYEKVYKIFITNQSYYETDINDTGRPYLIFGDGRAMFISSSLNAMSGADSVFKKMEDGYGVLPQPKYKTTDEYMSFVNGAASMVAVINLMKDESTEDFVGSVIEGLANASYNMVTYQLIEVCAKAKNVQDQESADMIDIVVRHRIFDFGYTNLFTLGLPCSTLFQNALDANEASVTARIAKGESSTKKNIENILRLYRKHSN